MWSELCPARLRCLVFQCEKQVAKQSNYTKMEYINSPKAEHLKKKGEIFLHMQLKLTSDLNFPPPQSLCVLCLFCFVKKQIRVNKANLFL